MKNKKGFTLVELLVVVALIGLLMGVGIPGVMRISENMKKKSLETKISVVEQNAVLWGQDNKTRLQNVSDCKTDEGTYSCYQISIKQLIEADYLDSENYSSSNPVYINPVTDVNLAENDDCKIYVYKKNNRVKAYLGNDGCKLITS